ncbi:EscU/YscU/HrcU family type III secretion system export apparatus switch protein [Alteraurantiacibacter buctensis]|uniref:Flagellar type III secretion system protein FlhB n=1 Tax=Alteraurantiacibacter buctensis TaxID=1503981 RepID=A0A844YVK4_9SPHN|nr:flagellar type III secretion system protein FlhB [Alteraurantiacibacter buctensis]MXO71172.1 flagellar type III secretion system protein FlhB [Alteraurantiacibacter buctensis]
MSEQAAGEKSFEPTEKKLKDAADKGNVLRSKEVATAVAMLVGALWLKLAGPWMLAVIEGTAERSLTFDRSALTDFQPGRIMTDLLYAALPPLFTLGLAVIAVTMVAQLAVGQGRWVLGNLAPKAERLSPLAGFKRMFGLTSLIELGKSFAKLGLLGAIAWYWGTANLSAMLVLGQGELSGQLSAAWAAIADLLLLLAAGLAVIAMIDWPIQFFRHRQQLMMTMQELKDEAKEAEGSPEKKQAIRQRQRDMARGGVAGAMKQAQFVITNPSHFAVAMAYDPAVALAPYVLAKGRDEKALAMKDLAREMALPTLEYPQLARAVYFTTRENQMVRSELYGAIASVLAFVMALKRGDPMERPQVAVPVELRFDADGRVNGINPGQRRPS